MRRLGRTLPIVLLAALGLFFLVPLEPRGYPEAPPPPVGAEAARLHREALVVDLHVDALLWPRDLTRRSDRGHVDFPRMRAGGLDAAAFTHATRFFGLAGVKALHDLWPPRTWFSPWERLRYQQERMRRFAAADGRVRLATTPAAIRENHRRGVLSYFHGIEGAHGLGTDPARLAELAREGVVFVGPVHLGANEYGGSSLGRDEGLTRLGERLLEEMNRHRILLDLAHAGPRTFREALERTTLPPLVSHTGVRAVHPTWRNLTDEQLRAVARRGGVVGIMLGPPALARPDLDEAFRHLAHVVELVGEDAAALGTDFDGYIETPFDATGLPRLTERMLAAGWSETRIRKILGENVLRVLGARLRTPPPSRAATRDAPRSTRRR